MAEPTPCEQVEQTCGESSFREAGGAEPGVSVTTEPPESASDAGAERAPGRGEETILLVEDEECVRVVVTAMLEARGYKVLAAATSAEALEIAQTYEGDLDLLLTDVVLPDAGGGETAKSIRSLRGPAIGVLYMSGYGEDRAAPPSDLGDGFIQKPFSGDELAHAVREVLDRRS